MPIVALHPRNNWQYYYNLHVQVSMEVTAIQTPQMTSF